MHIDMNGKFKTMYVTDPDVKKKMKKRSDLSDIFGRGMAIGFQFS